MMPRCLRVLVLRVLSFFKGYVCLDYFYYSLFLITFVIVYFSFINTNLALPSGPTNLKCEYSGPSLQFFRQCIENIAKFQNIK